MNNSNIIRLVNENGQLKTYGEIPDLWHIACHVHSTHGAKISDAILQVMYMAHDLKACIEGQGQAKILQFGPAEQITIEGDAPTDDDVFLNETGALDAGGSNYLED